MREGVERRAISAGAAKAYVVDAKETFALVKKAGLLADLFEQSTTKRILPQPLLEQRIIGIFHRSRGSAASGCLDQNVGLRSGVNAGGVPSVLQKTSSMRFQLENFSSIFLLKKHLYVLNLIL